jgi:hypothetical protein
MQGFKDEDKEYRQLIARLCAQCEENASKGRCIDSVKKCNDAR